ncbi:MAG TPA: hypothetical protein DDY91_21005 [Planctomycetaceae bacterium]|nr:hypothetical protein [Planctomycetaceae bacterium]
MPWLPPRPLLPLDLLADRSTSPAITGFTIDAATKRAGVLFRPTPQQSISQIGLFVQQIVGTPPTCEVRLETVVNGSPSGALVAPTARGVFTPQANTWTWVSLEAPCTPATGASLAALVAWSAGTVGTTSSATFALRYPACFAGQNPSVVQYTGTAWSPVAGVLPLVVPRHVDGSLLPGCAAIRGVTWQLLTSTGNPTEVGNRFVVPFDASLDALCTCTRLPAGGRANLRLLTETGVTLASLDSQPLDALVDLVSTSAAGVMQAPVNSCNVTAGSSCLITQGALTTGGCHVARITFADAASREALCGPMWWVQRQGTGAWSEDLASVAALSPRVSAVNVSAGAGRSPRHPGMSGGMVG